MIETLNNAVILPHLPNWTDPVKLRRSWATSVASGINGSEDRATERTAALRKITYKVSTLLGDGPQESDVLAERLKAALQSGRAVCPLFGRAQAVQSSGATALESLGLWPWVTGEYAFLSLGSHAGINQEVLIDVGGAGVDAFQPEANFTHSGGSVHTIVAAIDTSDLAPGIVPPQAVLQNYRSVPNAPSPAPPIVYTVTLTAKYRVKLRLWFAFESNPGGTFGVSINYGAPTFIDPWAACGSAVLTAGFVDVPCWPDAAGKLRIEISMVSAAFVQLNAIEVFSTCWQMIPIHEVQALDVPTLVFAAERLKFASLADIEQIYPVLWGKLSIGDMTAITNWHGEVEISVAEPLGSEVVGLAGLAQTELCGIPIDPNPGATETVVGTFTCHFMANALPESGDNNYAAFNDYVRQLAQYEWDHWVEEGDKMGGETIGNFRFTEGQAQGSYPSLWSKFYARNNNPHPGLMLAYPGALGYEDWTLGQCIGWETDMYHSEAGEGGTIYTIDFDIIHTEAAP